MQGESSMYNTYDIKKDSYSKLSSDLVFASKPNYSMKKNKSKTLIMNFEQCQILGKININLEYNKTFNKKLKIFFKNFIVINSGQKPITIDLLNFKSHTTFGNTYFIYTDKFDEEIFKKTMEENKNIELKRSLGFIHAINNFKEVTKNISTESLKSIPLVYAFNDGSLYIMTDDIATKIKLHHDEKEITKFINQSKDIFNDIISYYKTLEVIRISHTVEMIKLLWDNLNNLMSSYHVPNLNSIYDLNQVFVDFFIVNNLNEMNGDNNILEKNKSEKTAINNIIQEFRSYSIDLVKMMERPILSNYRDPEVKAFNQICLSIEHSIEEVRYLYLLTQWESLKQYADIQRLDQYNDDQKLKFKKAKVMLDKTLHENTNDNEKVVTIKGLIKILEGILPINNEVLTWLKQETGLKEIER